MSPYVVAEGFPPTLDIFHFNSDPAKLAVLNKAMVLSPLAMIIVIGFFFAATRKMKVVPSRLQFAAEYIYNIGRDNIAREQIGAKEFKPFVPLVFALLTYIFVNNIFEIVPLIYLPTMSHIGFALAMSVLVVYPVYHFAGIRKFGFFKYMKNQLFPPGAPALVYILLAPIEFITRFIANPLTLAIRVFAATLAGHLLLAVFIEGGWTLVFDQGGGLAAAGVASWIFAIIITFLEVLIMAIQAYVFAVLSASYIGMALQEDH